MANAASSAMICVNKLMRPPRFILRKGRTQNVRES